jgi:predicted RNase H-like HicB family nuclease
MRKYLIIYEKSKDGYSAYLPDLPGCTSAGATKKEVEENIIEAINLHVEVMKESGLAIPEANSESEMLVLA